LLTTLGGFTGNDLSPTSDIRFLFQGTNGYELQAPPASEYPFEPRGGAASILLDNDTILLVGGINTTADLDQQAAGSFEVYTPSILYDPVGGIR
jgi:hypothetical protein